MRPFVFLFCFFSFTCFAQDPDAFKKSGEGLDKVSSTLPKDIKLKIVKSLNHFIIKEIYSQDHMDLEKDLNNFTFVDYDSDHDLDIIYYGPIGGEPLGTIFFMNSDNSYGSEFLSVGQVKEIKIDNTSQQLYFKMIESPCCADIVEGTVLYQVDFSKPERVFTTLNRYHYIAGTGKPTDFIAPLKFKILNPQYKLRHSPEIDDTPLDPNSEFNLPGNVIAEYSAGASGTAIASKTDATGKVWWFVIMDYNSTPIRTIIHDMDSKSKFYTCGWLSNRYAEKLE